MFWLGLWIGILLGFAGCILWATGKMHEQIRDVKKNLHKRYL